MSLIGYIRVSSTGDNPADQRKALLNAGCDRFFEDTPTPNRHERPGFVAAMEHVEAGDVLVVWRLDRIGRSLGHLVRTIDDLTRRGVCFRSLAEGIDTGSNRQYTAAELFAVLASFEEELIRERTRPGLVAALASHRPSGRKPSITAGMLKEAKSLVADGLTVREAASRLGVGKTTLYAALKPDYVLPSSPEFTEASEAMPKASGRRR